MAKTNIPFTTVFTIDAAVTAREAADVSISIIVISGSSKRYRLGLMVTMFEVTAPDKSGTLDLV